MIRLIKMLQTAATNLTVREIFKAHAKQNAADKVVRQAQEHHKKVSIAVTQRLLELKKL